MATRAIIRIAEREDGVSFSEHPKKIRTGTLQHEIMVHASIDAYFGGGKKGSERTKQFAGKLSEHFKGIDFKIPEIVEGAKGDKFAVQRKLVEKIEPLLRVGFLNLKKY